jgi:hypothetical protein
MHKAPGSDVTVVSTTIGVIIPSMWTVHRDYPGPVTTLRLRFYASNQCLTYAEFLRALVDRRGTTDIDIGTRNNQLNCRITAAQPQSIRHLPKQRWTSPNLRSRLQSNLRPDER